MVVASRAQDGLRLSDVLEGRRKSPALEVRVQAFEPVAAHPAAIAAAGTLRHDPLEAQLARLGEHERAVISDRAPLAAPQAGGRGDRRPG